MKQNKYGFFKTAIIVIFVFVLTITPAFGKEKEAYMNKNHINEVYIAGNPKMEPFEFFDPIERCYKGALPRLYERLSKSLGIKFKYISPSRKNIQTRLYENGQVEIVSAYKIKNRAPLPKEAVICDLNEKEKVVILFTDNMPKEEEELIRKAILSLTNEEKLSLLVSDYNHLRERTFLVHIVFFSGAFVLAIVWFLVKGYKKRKTAFVDPLTGLLDKKGYEKTFGIFSSSKLLKLCYVVYISADLRTLSQAESTSTQIQIGKIIAGFLEDKEKAFRIGDGNFLLIILNPTKEKATFRIKELLNKINSLFDEEQNKIIFRGGLYNPTNSADDFSQSLERAKHGWQIAKETARDVVLVDEETIRNDERRERILKSIPNAINKEEFKVYLQFIVDAKTEKIQGAEALSRWKGTRDGLVFPKEYISVLTDKKLISELDFFVLERCCEILENWSKTNMSHLFLSCNFSWQTMAQEDFLEKLLEISSRFCFPHEKLVLEINWDALLEKEETTKNNLLGCKKNGFKISLEDIGRKNSILQSFYVFPADFIKLDNKLSGGMLSEWGEVILKGLVTSVHELGGKIVCEGIGREERKTACNIGCDYIQSFQYSRVFPVDVAIDFYEKSVNSNFDFSSEEKNKD